MADRSSGGVRNIRAMFEARQDAEPPSRSRSPAGSELSDHSRPRSKVRTSFVSVEGKSGQSGSRSRDMDGTASEGGDVGHRLSTTSDPRSSDPNGTAIGRSPSLGRVREEGAAKEPAVGGSDSLQSSVGAGHEPIATNVQPKDHTGPKQSPSKSKSVTSPSKVSPVKEVKEAARAVGSKASELKSKVEAKVEAKSASAKHSSLASSSKQSSKPSQEPASIKTTKVATTAPAAKTGAAKTATPSSRTSRLSTASTKAASGPSKPATSRPSAPSARPDVSKKEGAASVGGFVKPPPKSPTKPVNLPAGAQAATTSSSAKVGRQSLASVGSSRRSGVGVARAPSTKSATGGAPTSTRTSLSGQPKATSTATAKPQLSRSARPSGVGVATKPSGPPKPASTRPTTLKPSAEKPATTKPAASSSTKPAAAKPVVSKPVATKPVAAKSAATKPVASKPSAATPTGNKASTSKSVASPASTKKDHVGTRPAVAKAIGAKAVADKVAHAQAVASEPSEEPSERPTTELQPPVAEPPLDSATKEAIAPEIAAEPEHGGEVEPSPDASVTPAFGGSLPERRLSKSEATDFAQTERPESQLPVDLSTLTPNEQAAPSETKPAVEVAPNPATEEALIPSAPVPEPVREPEPEPEPEPVHEPELVHEPEPAPKPPVEPKDTPAVAPLVAPEPPLVAETHEAIAPRKPAQAKLEDIVTNEPIEAALSPPNSAVAEALAEAPPKPSGPTPSVDLVKQQAAELEMAANELAQIDSAAPAMAPELSKEPMQPSLKKQPSTGSGRSGGSRPSLHREASMELHLPEAAKPSQPTEEEIAEHRRQSVAAEEMQSIEKPQKPVPQASVAEEALITDGAGQGEKETEGEGENLLVDLD